jgi:dihydroflavonol-4-reductase
MCWAHVEDIALAHIAMMEKGRVGETYIVGGEQSTVINLFRVAKEVSGVRLPPIVPYQLFLILSTLAKPFDRWLPDTFTSEGMISIAGVTYLMDHSKAARELGFNPRPIRVGWAETVRHEMNSLRM